MSGKSNIQWTDNSWNPVTGCTRVSKGCDQCYAFTLHDQRHEVYKRDNGIYMKTGKPIPRQYALPFSEIQLMPERLEDPLRWKTPKKIFVNSMSDLFHSKVPDDFILQVFAIMNRAHWHTFQVLTKRPGRLTSGSGYQSNSIHSADVLMPCAICQQASAFYHASRCSGRCPP